MGSSPGPAAALALFERERVLCVFYPSSPVCLPACGWSVSWSPLEMPPLNDLFLFPWLRGRPAGLRPRAAAARRPPGGHRGSRSKQARGWGTRARRYVCGDAVPGRRRPVWLCCSVSLCLPVAPAAAAAAAVAHCLHCLPAFIFFFFLLVYLGVGNAAWLFYVRRRKGQQENIGFFFLFYAAILICDVRAIPRCRDDSFFFFFGPGMFTQASLLME